MNLANSTLIITGAAGNIGTHLVNYLSSKSKRIIAIDLNFSDDRSFSDNVDQVNLDVTKEEDVQTFFSNLDVSDSESLGLLNGAGIIFNRPLVNILDKKEPIHSYRDFDKVIQLNLGGSFLMGGNFSNKCIKAKKKACIINVSSVTASGNVGQTAYSSSKAAVESMARVWAKELGMFKIRAAAIAPGFFNTESTQKSLSEATLKKYKSAIPLRKLGDLDDLAQAVEFIFTNEYFNGEVLALNGGYRV